METMGHEEFEHEHEGGHDGDVTGYALLDSKHVYSKPIEYETGTSRFPNVVNQTKPESNLK